MVHERSRFKSLTSHRNVILSVLEAVLGRSFTRPTYAKARMPKTPAMEKAEVAVNTPVAFMSAMTMFSTWMFEKVAVLGVKGRCVQSDHRSLVGWAPLCPLAAY